MKKDAYEHKERRENKSAEAQAELHCKEVGCDFFGQSKAVLVIHDH